MFSMKVKSSSGTLKYFFGIKYSLRQWRSLVALLFLGAFLLGDGGTLPKIVINLPRTYEKLQCKEEVYWSSGYGIFFSTERHTKTDHVSII